MKRWPIFRHLHNSDRLNILLKYKLDDSESNYGRLSAECDDRNHSIGIRLNDFLVSIDF